MELEEILGLCIGVPSLIALISLCWYFCVSEIKHREKQDNFKNQLEKRKVEALESLAVHFIRGEHHD